MLTNNRLLIGSSDGTYLLDTLTGRIETADSLVGERIVGNQLNAYPPCVQYKLAAVTSS